MVTGGTWHLIYQWNNVTTNSQYVSNLCDGGIYSVIVTYTKGCAAYESIMIKPCIEITSAFTPNGDGKNDIWYIKNIEFYSGASIQIFNR